MKLLSFIPEYQRGIKSGYDPSRLLQDFIFGAITTCFYVALFAWLAFYFSIRIKKLRYKSYLDKFDYLMDCAGMKGFTDNLYASETVIDFLNARYSLKIEKDPFRVWKEPFFRRNGEYWIVGYMGKRILLNDYIVVEKIANLLAKPNKVFLSYELNKMAPENIGELPEMVQGKDKDGANDDNIKLRQEIGSGNLTKKGCERMLKESQDLEKSARDSNDRKEILNCQSKVKFMKKYIKETFTRNGKEKPPRDGQAKDSESLKREINKIIKKIDDIHPLLAEHLRHIKKQNTFSYKPPDDTVWDVHF